MLVICNKRVKMDQGNSGNRGNGRPFEFRRRGKKTRKSMEISIGKSKVPAVMYKIGQGTGGKMKNCDCLSTY